VPFKDRKHAGQTLAELPQLKELDSPVVVSLPRGAVVIAVEICDALGAPLMVMPVEEIATPGNPEYVVGAVAENAIHVIDAEALAALGVTEDSLAIRVAEATAKIASLAKIYREDGEELPHLLGRPIIVVDDGSASAPGLEAVAVALARHSVERLVLVTPAVVDAPVHGYEQALTIPRSAEHTELIGLWYDDKSAPSDEVAAQLQRECVERHPG